MEEITSNRRLFIVVIGIVIVAQAYMLYELHAPIQTAGLQRGLQAPPRSAARKAP